MPRGPQSLSAGSLLHGGLLALLSLTYLFLVYVCVVSLGALLVDDLRGPGASVPRWLSSMGLIAFALTVWPVVRWLDRQTADLVYGQLDDPYALVSQINELLQNMVHPRLTLPAVAQAVAGKLNLPYVAFETTDPLAVFDYGDKPDRAVQSDIEIVYLGRQMGTLSACGRGSGQRISASDLNILSDIARQVGVALHASLLTVDLQDARERLVIAREEERRRIRNDLHDGLAPTLSSLQLQLGGLRNLISSDPAKAEALAEDLKDDLKGATSAIRQLVYDLRPPMLDELGLVAALKNLGPAGSIVRFEVEAPEKMPVVSAAVEVALFRIAGEAIHNVVKHSGASACVTRIQADDDFITLTVTDDGRAPSTYAGGIGLASMRERAAELGGTCAIEGAQGGGTRVVARLPIGPQGTGS